MTKEELLEQIDKWLKEVGGREVISTVQANDMLLDIRSAIQKAEFIPFTEEVPA